MTGRAGQRSQSMVEFAIVAPLLLLFIFGVVDFGRVVYIYVTLNQAVNEGARTAIRSSPLLPTNADVESSVKVHAVDVTLANPCPNGPVTAATPPANQGWVYITAQPACHRGDSVAIPSRRAWRPDVGEQQRHLQRDQPGPRPRSAADHDSLQLRSPHAADPAPDWEHHHHRGIDLLDGVLRWPPDVTDRPVGRPS